MKIGISATQITGLSFTSVYIPLWKVPSILNPGLISRFGIPPSVLIGMKVHRSHKQFLFTNQKHLKMVTVKGYREVEKQDGTTFISLELNGGLEMVQSSNTGKFYGTIRKANLATTFDAETAKSLVGQELKGDIVRVSCDPYEYVSPTTGEVMMLQHTYAYQPEGSMELIGKEPANEPVTA